MFFEASHDLKVEDMQIVVFGDVSAMHLCISACVKVHRCASLLVEVKVDVFCNAIRNLTRQAKQSQMAAILLRKADLSRILISFFEDSHDSHGLFAKVPYFDSELSFLKRS